MTDETAKHPDGAARKHRRMLRIGAVGSIVTALCCFTPLLVVVLAALGFGAWTGSLDAVLFPLLGAFLALFAVGWVRTR
ncbi:MAG: mercury resistance system transport protein MerF, partial [Gammaproteobacteria bacterium]|nr:mercury resistance system transport protein MerF [Gammaproteobacteria bacterium]